MKIIKFLLILIISPLFFVNTYAAENEITIIDVDSTNSSVVKIFFDKKIETNSIDLDSDVKVFKDLYTDSIIRDLTNDKLITINLSSDLKTNTSYSLLSVYWVEWSIDFDINDLINWLEITWSDSDWVSKVSIIDSKTINIEFKKSILSDDIDVKLLSEFNVNSLKFWIDNKNELSFYLENKLDINSNYLIMIFSLTTTEKTIYTIANFIYSFKTEILSDEIIKEPVSEIINEENEIDNVALNSAETPDTWTETWILMFLTFILSTFIYYRKKV